MQRGIVLAAAQRPAEAILGLEWLIAPACAAALLLHPSPLSWPALLIGMLPSAGRWITTGRPWRATPFDVAIVLVLASAVIGMAVTLAPSGGEIRLTGLLAALILFAWIREQATSPRTVWTAAVAMLTAVAVGSVLLIHVAAPFLRLERVTPLAAVATVLEPLGLFRALVADEDALQRFRFYASGVGAVSAVGLAMTFGLALGAASRRQRALMAVGAIYFCALLVVSDSRGSMIAAALTLGSLVVWWRPRLLLVAALVVFGTLDLIALGVVQRGFNLRTVVERLDFWQKGLLLAAETPFTGVGLGVESVQTVYRHVFQPAYPPFSHAHNIFVQALLEQGILGFAGFLLIAATVVRLGAASDVPSDPGARAASLAALGGCVALLTAGLAEIAALTAVGGALLFALLGLLVAAHDAAPARPAPSGLPARVHALLGSISGALRPARSRAGTLALLVLGLIAIVGSGLARPLAALPLLNAGTSALYRGTLADDLSRAERAQAIGLAIPALRLAAGLDPGSVTALHNLSLAYSASGDRAAGRRLADEARDRAASGDVHGRLGVGRAYVAAGELGKAIDTWTEIGAGPQLLRLGRQLVQGPSWETGVRALTAAALVGAPARPAADAITGTALAHGESTEAAIGRLEPFLTAGGQTAYFAHLQRAHLYRLDGKPERAAQAVVDADQLRRDEQIALERGLQLVWAGRFAEAEAPLRWAVEHPAEPPHPVPDGDDPHYWLAVVLAKLSRHGEAVATARAGLAALPTEQASLRVPYHVVIAEGLAAQGKTDEALAVLQAGQRLAPSDPKLAEALTRVRAMRP